MVVGMKRDIISMAREAGFVTGLRDYADGDGSMPYVQSLATSTFLPELERFAVLVAAAEREACAKVCESLSLEWDDQPNIAQAELATMMDCALAIRARSQQ